MGNKSNYLIKLFFDELLNKYNDNKIMQKLLINYTEGAYFSSEETNKRFSFNVKK